MIKEKLERKINLKTKPLGSLGVLEEIALKIGLIQNTESPVLNRPAIVVFAADHGLTNEGISPYPKDVTWQMVMNFVGGGAAINIFCKQHGIDLMVVDAGVDHDFPFNLPVVNAKIGYGTKNMLVQPAMTLDECETAMQKGGEIVKDISEKGCNVIGFGEMGIGNTSASSLLLSSFLNIPVEKSTGAGAGSVGKALEKKKNILTKVFQKYQPETPLEKLATFGGFEIAMMTGAYAEAYTNNMVILVDGFISSVALLVATNMEPDILKNCIFCHHSAEKAHKLLLEHFGVKPLLDMGMRLGEGSGIAVAYPIIKSAICFLNEMSSFEEAGVSQESTKN